MTTIDILTTSAYPEMESLCRWRFERQTMINTQRLHQSGAQGSGTGRRQAQIDLLESCTADLFMMTDDDDYLDGEFLARAVERMQCGMYGEIVMRTYLMNPPAYGEASEPREYPFLTMVVFDRERWCEPLIEAIKNNDSRHILELGKPWPASEHMIIMRGLMDDPGTSITAHKNRYHEKYFPHRDAGHAKLKEWLVDDAEAFERYTEFARCE